MLTLQMHSYPAFPACIPVSASSADPGSESSGMGIRLFIQIRVGKGLLVVQVQVIRLELGHMQIKITAHNFHSKIVRPYDHRYSETTSIQRPLGHVSIVVFYL